METTGSTTAQGTVWAGWLADQVEWHWQTQARPRLEGLGDEEYRWEPTPGAWNIRPQGSDPRPDAVVVGEGAGVIDWSFQAIEPAPLTTIAWRLAHVNVGVLGDRNARHFGGEPVGYDSYDYPLTADRALADLDAGFAQWVAGVRGLDAAELLAPCREPGHEEQALAELVLHINRELIHHLSEVALLRDLWAHRDD